MVVLLVVCCGLLYCLLCLVLFGVRVLSLAVVIVCCFLFVVCFGMFKLGVCFTVEFCLFS